MKERYYELLEQVDSKETFLRFLNVLAIDWQASQSPKTPASASPDSSAADDWQNPSLGSFLQSMHSWALTQNAKTGEPNLPEEATWNAFARMLAAAKVYE